MARINSKNKGAVGEREAAKVLTDMFGVECKRGVQYQGGPDSPDVTGLPGVHVEVKRVQNFSVKGTIDQIEKDRGDKPALIMHRRNNAPWLAIVPMDQLIDLINALYPIINPTVTTTQPAHDAVTYPDINEYVGTYINE
jgi:hypothetical protein